MLTVIACEGLICKAVITVLKLELFQCIHFSIPFFFMRIVQKRRLLKALVMFKCSMQVWLWNFWLCWLIRILFKLYHTQHWHHWHSQWGAAIPLCGQLDFLHRAYIAAVSLSLYKGYRGFWLEQAWVGWSQMLLRDWPKGKSDCCFLELSNSVVVLLSAGSGRPYSTL